MYKLTTVAIVIGGSWLLTASTASSQTVSQFDAARTQNRGPFSAATYSTPTVSPYVNLGVGPNGLSNYQTLVRPLIEEREIRQRQSAALDQLNQRMRGAATSQGRREPIASEAHPRPRVRFMDYSHYFGNTR